MELVRFRALSLDKLASGTIDTGTGYTYTVSMNVTLSIGKRTVERARTLAQSRGTTLNQMVRDFLDEITSKSSPAALVEELNQLWSQEDANSGGRDWKRADLYDRPILR